MGTLKSTLKLESTDLFPTPVSFTKINNNTVAGNFSGFNAQEIASAAAANLNIQGIGTTGAFVYLESLPSNGTAIFVGAGTVTVSSSTIRLEPGDVAFFPAGDSNGLTSFSAICNTSGTATLNYFVGQRG